MINIKNHSFIKKNNYFEKFEYLKNVCFRDYQIGFQIIFHFSLKKKKKFLNIRSKRNQIFLYF